MWSYCSQWPQALFSYDPYLSWHIIVAIWQLLIWEIVSTGIAWTKLKLKEFTGREVRWFGSDVKFTVLRHMIQGEGRILKPTPESDRELTKGVLHQNAFSILREYFFFFAKLCLAKVECASPKYAKIP